MFNRILSYRLTSVAHSFIQKVHQHQRLSTAPTVLKMNKDQDTIMLEQDSGTLAETNHHKEIVQDDESSNSVHLSVSADKSVNCIDSSVESASTVPHNVEPVPAENRKRYCFPTPVLLSDYTDRFLSYDVINAIEKKYNWNEGIVFIGVSNFLTYAAYFCKNEAPAGDAIEVISVGSGDGAVDNEIIKTYREHFGTDLNITLVDPNPKYEVHFKTVDDLINERPGVVENCLVLITWPDPKNDNYDIESLRKLRPCAALTLYESFTGSLSGSDDFRAFLGGSKDHCYKNSENSGLDDYAIEEIVSQEVHRRVGDKVKLSDSAEEVTVEPGTCFGKFRLMKLKRMQSNVNLS